MVGRTETKTKHLSLVHGEEEEMYEVLYEYSIDYGGSLHRPYIVVRVHGTRTQYYEYSTHTCTYEYTLDSASNSVVVKWSTSVLYEYRGSTTVRVMYEYALRSLFSFLFRLSSRLLCSHAAFITQLLSSLSPSSCLSSSSSPSPFPWRSSPSSPSSPPPP